MKNKIQITIQRFGGVIAIGALALATACSPATCAADAPGAPGACVSDHFLAGWQDIYFRWFVGAITIPPDTNGNAVLANTVLLPLPNAPGDGTPGQLDVSVESDEGFTLPLLYLLGTSYTDGTPNDPLVNIRFFETLQLTFQIDGHVLINHWNLMDYYSEFYFEPPIPINSPPINSVIWCEDIGCVHGPLSVGTHTLKLDVKSTEALPPNFGGGYPEYHNTWNVTVKPGRHH